MEDAMRLSAKAMAMAGALLWGGFGMLGMGLLNLIWPSYGEHFLITMSSVYPGFHANRTIGDVLTGACYGALDGAVAALVFAWIYNWFTPE
jgi:hypothetical protein